MANDEVFIVGAARTPIGSFMGALSTVPVTELGATAVGASLSQAGLAPADVQETLIGNVLTAGVGQAPARQAAKRAGVPDAVPATTVGKVCGSGLQAVLLGVKSIRAGDAEIVLAGGMESMSQAPYLLPGARTGYRMGHQRATDSMIHDGLWDPYTDQHMGNCGELCAKEFDFTREAQDAFARQSYTRAQAAQAEGRFAAELTKVTVRGRKGDTQVEQDEEPSRVHFEKMGKLRPAFSAEGTITAANASTVNDGAAALVLASGRAVEARKLTPLARIVGYGAHAQAPEWFTTAPIGAMDAALGRTGLQMDDIDLFEINEAFAVVPMAAIEKRSLDAAKVNVHGGAVALGHPIGCSGARILVTLVHALRTHDKKRGMASICIGGGEGLALVVEKV